MIEIKFSNLDISKRSGCCDNICNPNVVSTSVARANVGAHTPNLINTQYWNIAFMCAPLIEVVSLALI